MIVAPCGAVKGVLDCGDTMANTLPDKALAKSIATIPEGGYLAAWMVAFAEWLAQQPKNPKIAAQVAAASEFAGRRIEISHIRNLRRRDDFKLLVDKFYQGGVVAARLKFENDLPFYITKHREGLELAAKEGDYRAYKDFTVPALERAVPRRDGFVSATGVTINVTLSDKQKTLLDSQPIDVDYEPLDKPLLPAR